MYISQLPATTEIGTATDDTEELARLLLLATNESPDPFRYLDVVSGTNRPGRILAQAPIGFFTTTAPLPWPYDAPSMAGEFFNPDFLNNEVRFPPMDISHARKGWEVRGGVHDGQPFVVVWAAWVR